MTTWYEEHKEQVKKTQHEYYLTHKAEWRERGKQWKKQNINGKSNCIDCNKPIDKGQLRCRSCSKLGDRNPMWKGENIMKGKRSIALHQWIRRHKPKPQFCEVCNAEPPYDVANISQEYKRDIMDYQWLCRRCHMKSDGRMNNLVKNTPISDEQKKEHKKEYWKKNRERLLKRHSDWLKKNKSKCSICGKDITRGSKKCLSCLANYRKRNEEGEFM